MLADFTKTAAFIILFGVAWNYVRANLADKRPDSPVLQAMTFAYN